MNGAYATLEMERCVSRSHGFDSHPVCPDRSGEDLDRRFSGRSGRCDRHECGAELCVVVFGMRHTRRSVGRHSALLHSADAKAGAGVARLGSVVGVRCRMCFRTLVRLLAFSASGPSDDRRRTESRCPGGEVVVGGLCAAPSASDRGAGPRNRRIPQSPVLCGGRLRRSRPFRRGRASSNRRRRTARHRALRAGGGFRTPR